MSDSVEQDLKNMELHEIKYPSCKENVSVIRVIGGWIYTIYSYEQGLSTQVSSVFVPENKSK